MNRRDNRLPDEIRTLTLTRDYMPHAEGSCLGETVMIDLCYEEDSAADVDMNIVMTDSGGLVEVQGTAERRTFDRNQLHTMLDASETAIRKIITVQKEALGLR